MPTRTARFCDARTGSSAATRGALAMNTANTVTHAARTCILIDISVYRHFPKREVYAESEDTAVRLGVRRGHQSVRRADDPLGADLAAGARDRRDLRLRSLAIGSVVRRRAPLHARRDAG